MEKIEKRISEINGGDVIDLATGKGDFLHFIKTFKNYNTITVLDIESKYEPVIKKYHPELEFDYRTGNTENLSFPDESFDTVCISNSLHHMKQPVKALKEAYRIVRKGGQLIVNEMYSDEQSQNEPQMSHTLFHKWNARIDRIQGITHNPPFKQIEILGLIEKLQAGTYETMTYSYPSENPKDKTLIDKLIELGKLNLKKLNSHDEYESLKKEYDDIVKHLMKAGFATAPSIMIIIGK